MGRFGGEVRLKESSRYANRTLGTRRFTPARPCSAGTARAMSLTRGPELTAIWPGAEMSACPTVPTCPPGVRQQALEVGVVN